MKKITSWRCVGLAVLTLLVSACVNNVNNKGSYLDAIPDNTVMSVKVNVNQLLTKSEVLENEQVTVTLKALFLSLSTPTRELMNSIVDNPEECGIDLDQSIVAAITDFEAKEGVVTMAVQSKAKLENFIKVITEDEDFDLDIQVNKVGNYSVVELNGLEIMCFDAMKCVVAISEDTKPAYYMNLAKENQAVNNANFMAFCDAKEDFVIYGDYEKIMELAGQMNAKLEMGNMQDLLNDAYMLLSLNFEKGKIVFKASYDGNEELKELASVCQANPTMNNMGFIPSNSLAVANFGIKDLPKMIEMVEFPDEVMDELNKGLEALNLSISDLEMFNGDITLALLPVNKVGREEVPQYMVMAECSESEWFETIASQNDDWSLVDANVYAMHENRYIDWDHYIYNEGWVYTEDGYDYYIGCKDGKFFVMPENIYSKCKGSTGLSELASNFTNSEFYGQLKKNGAVGDVKRILSELDKVEGISSDSDWEMMSQALSVLKSVGLSYSGQTTIISFEFKDNSENSLKVIFDALLGAAFKNL